MPDPLDPVTTIEDRPGFEPMQEPRGTEQLTYCYFVYIEQEAGQSATRSRPRYE